MFKKIVLSFAAIATLAQAHTLKDSVERVLETNPIVLERLANYKETAKDLSIANSEYLPTLDLSATVGQERTDNDNANIIADNSLNFYETSLTLMLNVFNGFGTTNKVDYQKARIVASAYNFVEKSNDTAFEMTRRYIEVIKHRELYITAKDNVLINEEIFEKVNDLYKTGLTTKSEVRKIESSLSLAKSNLVVQENNIMDSIFNFKKVYGERLDVDTLEIPSFNVYLPKSLNEASEYAIRNNPSIMVSNYNIKAAEYLKSEKEKDFYPKIDLIAQQNLDKNTYSIAAERNRLRAGVILTYNLYRGGADVDNVEKHISSIYKNVQIRNELQRETLEGLELSWSAYKMTQKQLVQLEKYKTYSEETLSLYKEEYDLGRRTLLDLLSAQNDFINAKSQIIKATYDGLFAKYRVLDSMGLLVAGIMGNEYSYMQKVGLAGVDAVDNIDTMPISYDEDRDNLASADDLCQASFENSDILSNGCLNLSEKYTQIKSFKLLKFGSNGELENSDETLKDIVDSVQTNSYKLKKLVIQSHSSATDSKVEDFKTSDTYAQNIRQYFIDAGVDRDKIVVVSNGSTAPISSDESLNDRVNVLMYSK